MDLIFVRKVQCEKAHNLRMDIRLQCGEYDVLEEQTFYETIDYLDESYKIIN